MRVVLDTNILISACWKPGGNEAAVVALVAEGVLAACVSEATTAEYREVAARRKFAAQRECLETAIAAVLETALRVAPDARCTACTDADDNQLLDCAVAAGARYVITGNLRHFPAEWEGVEVINARTLLDRLNR
jgi:putative PIN family toxin of toxin-antitoxin system